MAQMWCSWFLMCLTLTFQGHLIFENSPFVPLHDWCTFRSDMFINSGDISHWNMEKLVCYVFRNGAIFCKVPRIGPSNMYANFEKNRWKIWENLTIWEADFQLYHNDSIQNSDNFHMTLTFDLDLTLTLSLTLRILKNSILYKLRDFRCKSYGPLWDAKTAPRMSSHGCWCVWHWPWHFKVIWFLLIHHLFPMHDWCKFRRDMFIISGDIEHWNMEKLPILYNGDFRCHGNVCYIILIYAFWSMQDT